MLTSNIFAILTTLLFLYALITGEFLLMENRRPQPTLAWMLVLFFAPGIGLLVYLLFGRDTNVSNYYTMARNFTGD
jgi:cardiolipin synthase